MPSPAPPPREEAPRPIQSAAQKQPAIAPRRGGRGGLLEGLASRLDLGRMETEDLLVLLILYLLYRESGDEEMLIMMGAMLLL